MGFFEPLWSFQFLYYILVLDAKTWSEMHFTEILHLLSSGKGTVSCKQHSELVSLYVEL